MLPDVHLMLTGSSGRVRELGRGDRDGYAWSYVGGESKWRGRLNWTSARKAVARERDPIVPQYDSVGKGLSCNHTLMDPGVDFCSGATPLIAFILASVGIHEHAA